MVITSIDDLRSELTGKTNIGFSGLWYDPDSPTIHNGHKYLFSLVKKYFDTSFAIVTVRETKKRELGNYSNALKVFDNELDTDFIYFDEKTHLDMSNRPVTMVEDIWNSDYLLEFSGGDQKLIEVFGELNKPVQFPFMLYNLFDSRIFYKEHQDFIQLIKDLDATIFCSSKDTFHKFWNNKLGFTPMKRYIFPMHYDGEITPKRSDYQINSAILPIKEYLWSEECDSYQKFKDFIESNWNGGYYLLNPFEVRLANKSDFKQNLFLYLFNLQIQFYEYDWIGLQNNQIYRNGKIEEMI